MPVVGARGASLGANCTILCGIKIGCHAFIGAGAVVLHDVPAYSLVVGNPARMVGWMCRCGERIKFPEGGAEGSCRMCGASYLLDGEKVEPVLRRRAKQMGDAASG